MLKGAARAPFRLMALEGAAVLASASRMPLSWAVADRSMQYSAGLAAFFTLQQQAHTCTVLSGGVRTLWPHLPGCVYV